jgi:hypothetical protein
VPEVARHEAGGAQGAELADVRQLVRRQADAGERAAVDGPGLGHDPGAKRHRRGTRRAQHESLDATAAVEDANRAQLEVGEERGENERQRQLQRPAQGLRNSVTGLAYTIVGGTIDRRLEMEIAAT